MKKSLEDIRTRYSGKSSSEGNSSKMAPRSSSAENSEQARMELKSPSSSNLNMAAEALRYSEPSNQKSAADFTELDVSSSLIADELGMLYFNETFNLEAIFPSSASVSTGDKDTSIINAFREPKTQPFSVASDNAAKEVGISPLVENMVHQSNLDPSKTNSSSSRAANVETVYTNEPASEIPPGTFIASDQGDRRPTCRISLNDESRSAIRGAVICASLIPPSTSSAELFSGALHFTLTDRNSSTASCDIVNKLLSSDDESLQGLQAGRAEAIEKSSAPTVDANGDVTTFSFETNRMIEEPLTNSCSVKEPGGKMKPDLMSGINLNMKHAVDPLIDYRRSETSRTEPTSPQTNWRQTEVLDNLDNAGVSYYAPDIDSTLSIMESSEHHPLELFPVITKEIRESGIRSQDPSTDKKGEVVTITYVGSPRAIHSDGSISSQEEKSHLKNSSVRHFIEPTQSTYFDCNGTLSECSNSPAARDGFFKPVGELLVESSRPTVDFSCENADESELYQLPKPNDYLQQNWVPQKISRLVLGTSGCGYEGQICNSKMHGHGRFYFGKDQYIEGKWETNSLVEPDVCRLTIDEPRKCNISVINTPSFYLVSIFEFDFVAKAISNCFGELDFSASVADLKASFLRKFRISEILNDEMRSKRELLLEEFKVALNLVSAEYTDVVKTATALFLLGKYANSLDAQCALLAIQKSDAFLPALRNAAADLLEIETSFNQRREAMNLNFSVSEPAPFFGIREIMINKYADAIEEHRRSLLSKCPTDFKALTEMIQKLPGETILYVTREDVGVFHHLLSLPCARNDETWEYTQNLFGGFLEDFSIRLATSKTGIPPHKIIPLTSSVFGYLYKSFSEIAEEIVGTVSECHFQDMLVIDQDRNWKFKVDIKWPPVHESKPRSWPRHKFAIFYQSSLEAQYHAIHQMLIFFSPGNYLKDRVFTYNFHILKFDPSWSLETPSDGGEVPFEQVDLEGLSKDRLAWLYILDNTVHHLFKDNSRTLIKLYNPLVQGYISFLQKSDADSHESFRVLMHSILLFLVSSAPYFTETIDRHDIDFEVLSHQMRTMTTAAGELEQGTAGFNNFRDLIEEYKRYWNIRRSRDVTALHQSSGYLSNQIHAVELKLGEVERISLAKDVPIINLVRFLRILNDFIADFKTIDFVNCWFVKSRIYDHTVMERIDNKISASEHCSYRVTNLQGFIKLIEGYPVPNHYIITVVSMLIEYIVYFFNRSWNYGNRTEGVLNIDRLESTGMLLDAVRHSFLYLKEQPDYVDFETFMKESTEPFKRIVYESKDLNDIKTRTKTVKESFWYIRNMDGIGIDKAMALFESLNGCPISSKFSSSYNVYLAHYNSYIETYCHETADAKHSERLDAVMRQMNMPTPLHFSEWSEGYKTKEIPKILAGLSAVWSILASKDVSSTGKFLKPHCIQILCVMRLLSIDKPNGCDNHLAQVLTGQGKSLVLGLLSSVLALTGHSVRVVCYSEYLSTRDESDFKAFFQQFRIADSIRYGTFQDMASGFLKPLCNGQRTNLRRMVRERVLYHKDWASLGSIKTESTDTVLLIDEVDVFFNDKFYGNCYEAVVIIRIPGLESIQYAMWKIAKDSECNAVQLKKLVDKHISEQISLEVPLYREWEAFCNKPGKFLLLVGGSNGKYYIKEYTNCSLIDEHLMKMAEDALLLRRSREMDHLFKLGDDGLIWRCSSSGQCSSAMIDSYRNTFAYFKLKNSDYSSLDSQNLGYLVLKAGRISYARLPCQFPLIMGVSGTLENLSEYEKTRIESYNIKEFSILPSFFGDPCLKFNEESDFTCLNERQDWLNEIYQKANEVVESHRAVLIFFYSDAHLNLFAGEFKPKFDRLNEITLITDSNMRDLYINEAGLSCTVTLATRVMGRGLDYKSSLSVEKNGGIHVIQTFFSDDIKEEIQIRGRTARKDNRGSYELIICKENLTERNFIPDKDKTEHTYSSLHPIRRKLMDRIGKRHAEMIMRSEHDHEITMTYYGLSQFNKTSTEPIVLSD